MLVIHNTYSKLDEEINYTKALIVEHIYNFIRT